MIVVLAGGEKRTQGPETSTLAEARPIPTGKTMTVIKTIPLNTEDRLETPEDIAAYLEAVFEDGNPGLISHALGAVTRSKCMTEIAHRTGLGRRSLYPADPIQSPLARRWA